MKVALLLTGLARKVEEGYEYYWKNIVKQYDTDVYLHFWDDEESEKVLKIYNPISYIKQKPFLFSKYRIGVESPNDDMSRPIATYDVAGNFRCLPMFYSWQMGYSMIEGQYDCVIRSRYDLGSNSILNLHELDFNNVNISNHHWPDWSGSPITDDNLCITNRENADIIFSDIFDEFISHIKQTGVIHFAEKNFMEILQRKNIYNKVRKCNELPFSLLRENKLWY